MISPEDIDLLKLVDGPQAAIDAIFDFYEARGFAQTQAEREQLLYL
jgi:predicted Rossmann-fold nucleotide-binding protein